MTRLFARLWRSRRGAAAAEFALVLPVLLALIMASIDCGRLLFEWNRAEKATQIGARYLAVTNLLPAGLAVYDFTVDGGLQQGEPIPASLFGGVSCTPTGCACRAGATCPPLGTFAADDFALLVARMRAAYPAIAAANVRVDYEFSGIGFAGDPNATDVAPLVTVWLTGLTFQPVTTAAFRSRITLPAFRASLMLEDGTGRRSN